MERLNELSEIVNSIKKSIYESNYKDNDIRKAYLDNLWAIHNEYYIGNIYFEISKNFIEITKVFKEKKIKFESTIISRFTPHLFKIYETTQVPELASAYQIELNKKLFLDTFTNFENTIDLSFEALKKEEDIIKIIKDLNHQLLKLFIEDSKYETVISQLTKTTFIPLIRKFRFLIKKGSYSGEKKKDIAFIEFCSKLRNCILHSNSYYKGRDFEYIFDNSKFIFNNNQFLKIETNDINLFLKLNQKTTNIVLQVFNCFNDIEYLEYPDDRF